MPRNLRFYERVIIAAADVQGDTPPSMIPDHDEAALASVPVVPNGPPATRDQLLEALSECERRGWMKLLKVFGPWSWGITDAGLEAADVLRKEDSETEPVAQTAPSSGPPPPQAPPALTTPAPQDPGQLLLQVVFDALIANTAWPTFQFVERRLGSTIDAAQILRSLPIGLISVDRVLNPDTPVRLRPRGVARCEGSSEVIAAFVWLLRWLARKEAEFQPASATQASFPQLSSEQAVVDWLRDVPSGRIQDLYLAYLLLEMVPDVWSGLGGNQDKWTVTPNRRVQRFLDLNTFDEFIEFELSREEVLVGANPPRATVDVAYRGLLSGFAADTPTGADWLGVESEAFAIADLITYRRVNPPLCIGIFGPWGLGKSFFMRLVSQRITALTARRRDQAETAEGPSDYCANIVQVRFNAWHYIEANLWASLAATIFASLADAVSAMGVSHEALRKRLFSQLDTAKLAMDAASRRLDLAKAARAEAENTLKQRQKAAANAQEAVARLTLGQLATEDPASKSDTAEIRSRLGDSTPRLTLGQLSAFSEAGRSVGAVLTSLRILPWRAQVRVLGGVAAPAVAALVAILILAILNQALAFFFSLPLSLAGLFGAWALINRIRSGVVPAVNRLIDREQSRMGVLVAVEAEQKALIESDVAEAAVRAAEVDLAAVEELEKGTPYRFVLDRYAASEYTTQLGMAAVVQRDFQKLSALLEKPLMEGSTERLERIVLYIDDLDRCPPTVVLEVLQAVHLLLAFPLFVVVIGVDVGWLYRAIGAANEIATGEVPHRYVEKIIQVPFWIRPLGASGFAALINQIAPAAGAAVVTILKPGEDAAAPSDSGSVAPPPLADESEAQPTYRLILTPPEVNVLSRMAAFIQTPRAAKRLVNVYRLLKCMTGSEASKELASGDDVTVVLQLALLCGLPEKANTVFEFVRRSQQRSLWGAITDLRTSVLGPTATQGLYGPVAVDAQLVAALDAMLALRTSGEVTTETWAYWAPLTARFAFVPPNL